MDPTPAQLSAVNLRLSLLGLPTVQADAAPDLDRELLGPLLERHREVSRHVQDPLAPVDRRIQDFLEAYLEEIDDIPQLPTRTLGLDQPGLARVLSLPADRDEYVSDQVESYRVANGVLHNPRNDRRTTAGVFHVVEGGLPIPEDKKAVSREAFAGLLRRAFEAPPALMRLPITSTQEEQAECFVSLLLRPLVVVGVPGQVQERRMETRFIVPGGLVANLDFVEGIFGNGGDPLLPDGDAATDPDGWTGTTGLVVLAPHLLEVTKRELGLPHRDDASERQLRDGMCWEDPDERYNDGSAFKVCARDERGVVVTVIADNYFGYCKKEVKTQISYSANLFGLAEEEHAGGAMVFPSWDEGREFVNAYTALSGGSTASVADVVARDPQLWWAGDGWARSLEHDHLVLVPAGSRYRIEDRSITWEGEGGNPGIPLRAGEVYLDPTGFRVRLRQVREDPVQWTIVGTSGTSTVCHKPATVSGGGKSEISKSIADAISRGYAYVSDIDADLDAAADLIGRDYSRRFLDPSESDARPLLGSERSVGSVIKLLTPSPSFTEEHNDLARSVPAHILELVVAVKRAYRPEWGDDWRSHVSVTRVDGRPGHRLRIDGEPVLTDLLRVGFETDGAPRLFSLRPDFEPSVKLQTEDDITASVVVPRGEGSVKVVRNCEGLLFQRPDDAVVPGYDTLAESDISRPGSFLSNFEPLRRKDVASLVEDAVGLSEYTAPMRELMQRFAAGESGADYAVCSSHPRIVDGRRSKNPRYLQLRPDLADPRSTAASLTAARLASGMPLDQPLPMVVDAVVAGRRNNPPGDGVPALCAYSPLHHLPLPELLMEYISSMTGKSPSTTGAGSEGAMTKGPFNALPKTYDLDAAFLSYALCEHDGWVSGAGHVGPQVEVAHDVSLLVPELFARMTPAERDAQALLEAGHLEPVPDLSVAGRTVHGSRLGYRITESFARTFLGRIFLHPQTVFTDEMLRPELQDERVFADSIEVMTTTHQRVAQSYQADGTIESACPPVRALLEIMADGRSREGWTLSDPEFRDTFTRQAVLGSEWYAQRLEASAQVLAGLGSTVTAVELVGTIGRTTAIPAQR